MNKNTLKELFDLEQQLGINEKDRFRNTKKGKELYALMFKDTEQKLDEAQKFVEKLIEKQQDYWNINIARQKAKELIKLYYNFVSGWTSINKPNENPEVRYEGEGMKIGRAKQCALICVGEILNEPKMKFSGNGVNDLHYKFWENVKKEIERL